MINRKDWPRLATGFVFLAPNIIGFVAFTMFPLIFSLVMAFSNYDLVLHNRFRHEPLQFPTVKNFVQLFDDPAFWTYLGNTLFFLLAVPVGIVASLGAALLLNVSPGDGRRGVRPAVIVSAVSVTGIAILFLLGAKATGIICLLSLLPCVVLLLGAFGGTSAYRTLFYLPSFTSGVAIYIVWAKLYNPQIGPINMALSPVLGLLTRVVNDLPPIVPRLGFWICLAIIILIFWITIRRLWILWNDGDLGILAAIYLVICLIVCVGLSTIWLPEQFSGAIITIATALIIAWYIGRSVHGCLFSCKATAGGGAAALLVFGSISAQLILLGLGIVLFNLPKNAAGGLQPPSWLTQYYWAKPALMLMGLWAAIGSNNMLLYLAALSNMPVELYEAADIDGAGRFAKFWNVTWPQLAPTTFFIAIISVIGGLQGGFDSARAMTDGGPAGSTTTLAYYIYAQGFQSGHLGYASTIAWTMFLIILMITAINWKYGGHYVND